MRILVGESGTVSTEHNPEEFRVLGSYVVTGSLLKAESLRRIGDEPGPDYIGPMLSTPEAARLMLKISGIKRSHTIATTKLAEATLEAAHVADDSPGTTVIEWETRDQVTAVRSRVLAYLMHEGYAPNDDNQQLPGARLFDSLCVVEDVLHLPRDRAIELATRFNEANVPTL